MAVRTVTNKQGPLDGWGQGGAVSMTGGLGSGRVAGSPAWGTRGERWGLRNANSQNQPSRWRPEGQGAGDLTGNRETPMSGVHLPRLCLWPHSPAVERADVGSGLWAMSLWP